MRSSTSWRRILSSEPLGPRPLPFRRPHDRPFCGIQHFQAHLHFADSLVIRGQGLVFVRGALPDLGGARRRYRTSAFGNRGNVATRTVRERRASPKRRRRPAFRETSWGFDSDPGELGSLFPEPATVKFFAFRISRLAARRSDPEPANPGASAEGRMATGW